MNKAENSGLRYSHSTIEVNRKRGARPRRKQVSWIRKFLSLSPRMRISKDCSKRRWGADTVRQMAHFMMGKGLVTLLDSLREAIVADVREESEMKLCEECDAHEKAIPFLKEQFAIMLAATDNEIEALKAKNVIENTVKDEMVNLFAHKWQPQLSPTIY